MKTYFIRVIKYAIYLVVLLGILLFVMSALSSNTLSLSEVMSSSRGIYLVVFLLVFALIQPFMGYVKRTLTFDATTQIEQITNVMALNGYSRSADENGAIVFRASSKAKRLFLYFEDKIVITTDDSLSVISGPRREVVRAIFRFNTFIG